VLLLVVAIDDQMPAATPGYGPATDPGRRITT